MSWLSKQRMPAILIGANFNDIKGFKDHYVVKFVWGPSLMLDECEAQMHYSKNPGHERHVNIDQGEIDASVFHDIMKISMNTSHRSSRG